MPEPEIIEQDGGILVTLFKDRCNEARVKKLGLNEQQVKAVKYAAENGKIANKQYQKLFTVSRNTASDDLNSIWCLGFFK